MIGGKSFIMEEFTVAGSWKCPAGVTNAILIGCGGGCGGRGGNSTTGLPWGFGGKGTVPTMKIVSVVPNTTYNISIGNGGLGGTPTNYGNNGGNTLFGTLATFVGATGSTPFYDLSAPCSLPSGVLGAASYPPSHGWSYVSGDEGATDFPYIGGIGGGCGVTGPGGNGGIANGSGLGGNGETPSSTNYGAGGGGGGCGLSGGGSGGSGVKGFLQVIWCEE